MANRTPLYEAHVALGARMVDFAGWEMPIQYKSLIEEHHVVRNSAGMFDVSHMCVVDLKGSRTREFLRFLVANDVARLDKKPGKALYTCMLNEQGCVIDDLIIYHMDEVWYRLVVNAGTRDKDLAWLRRQAPSFGVEVTERAELAMIAVQGPQARDKVHAVLGNRADGTRGLERFSAYAGNNDLFIARTGYTGEDGYEVVLPAEEAEDLWNQLLSAGVAPCGLGARDTLRLEAGMNLYGQDMDEHTTPLEAGLAWTVAFEPADRQFIGRPVLDAQRTNGVPRQLVAIVLEEKGVLRSHQKVRAAGIGEGEITSGSFSPTLSVGIAFVRMPAGKVQECEVEMRGKWLKARVIKAPFVKDGKANF